MSLQAARSALLLLVSAGLLSACATLTRGASAARTVRTDPAGAKVAMGARTPRDAVEAAETARAPSGRQRTTLHVWNETIDPPAPPPPPPPPGPIRIVVVGAPGQG